MKKQIITVVAVALAAVLLFVAYGLFFKDSGIEEVGDPFYTLNGDVKTSLSEIDTEVEILLQGYNSADEGWVIIQRFAAAVVDANDNFSLSTEDASEPRVKIMINDRTTVRDIEINAFFKTLYDGTRYAFDGESLIANAIFELCGKEAMEISLRALDGYDTDGDTLTSNGAPFVFPSIQRSEISFLSINNSHSKYSIYQEEGKFYFSSSRAVAYDEEMFALLTTNCRYVVAYGKMEMPEGQNWASYGLDKEENAFASYSIMTVTDEEGIYDLHTVYIGKLASGGTYYYARYIGGRFESAESEDGDDKLLHNFSKDIIYFIPVSSVNESIALPETEIMTPTIMTPITDSQQLFTIDNIQIDYYDKGISALAKNMAVFNAADNLSAIDTSSLTKVISDKKSANSDYKSYSGGWSKNINVFGGFTSSDGKSTYIDAALTRFAKNGNYRVKFGILRDEAGGAYLPDKITITQSFDGTNWHEIENGVIYPSHSDGTVANYELSFVSETVVKFIRIEFDVPQRSKSYVVFDEIRIYADDDDAQPVEAISGVWKFIAPSDILPDGLNYTYVDMTNFNDFVQSIAALEGERVVACGFSNGGDATPSLLDKELLGKYGLAEPARHYSFEYDSVVCDVYVSAPNEEGKYYAYSTYSGEVEGKYLIGTADIIVELSAETTKWLAWDFVEFLDHSLFSIYLTDITDMTVSFDGTDYEFILSLNEEGALGSVSYNGKSFDTESFKYVYQSILSIYMQDEYIPEEGDNPEEYLRIKINSETNSPELVFYRVSATKCYFTINGEGSYYALVEEVNEVREKILSYVAGNIVTK